MKPKKVPEGANLNGNDDICYRVNEQDEIMFVNEAWIRFAEANDGWQLATKQILHRSIWDFIADVTTRQVYRDLLKRVRQGRRVRFTFRCDSPVCRRLMEMRVVPALNGEIEFRTRILSQEDRQTQPLMEAGQARNEERVLVCGWCLRVRVEDRWLEMEEAVLALRLFENPVLPLLNHTICQTCYEAMSHTLGRPGSDPT
jgi:hypothetical protein